MFKFYIKKCYVRRTCSSETKKTFEYDIYLISHTSGFPQSTVDLEPFAQHPTTLTSKLQRHWRRFQKIWIIYKKIPETSKIRRNSGNPKKTEILVFRISEKSI